jgi:hypothetical protein
MDLCSVEIRIPRIRVFLGLPDPDSLVRGPDPDPSLFHRIFFTSLNSVKKGVGFGVGSGFVS